MKDYRNISIICIKYGFFSFLLYIGPIIYFVYRRKSYDRSFIDVFIASLIISVALIPFGIILYILETIKFYFLK